MFDLILLSSHIILLQYLKFLMNIHLDKLKSDSVIIPSWFYSNSLSNFVLGYGWFIWCIGQFSLVCEEFSCGAAEAAASPQSRPPHCSLDTSGSASRTPDLPTRPHRLHIPNFGAFMVSNHFFTNVSKNQIPIISFHKLINIASTLNFVPEVRWLHESARSITENWNIKTHEIKPWAFNYYNHL